YAPRGGGQARELATLIADLHVPSIELEPRVLHAPPGRSARLAIRASGPPATARTLELAGEGIAIDPVALTFDERGSARAEVAVTGGPHPRTVRIEARLDGRPALRAHRMPP